MGNSDKESSDVEKYHRLHTECREKQRDLHYIAQKSWKELEEFCDRLAPTPTEENFSIKSFKSSIEKWKTFFDLVRPHNPEDIIEFDRLYEESWVAHESLKK